ncbi:hypothetical protein FIV00_01955 [Labrenzia sp. THAF82]|uniref:hypothetical protein n=1 Tax=Labrenzia sp. THAF82 TaxID=2587861 RepID=UPI0012A8561D|nr:hypothetical protein [Labrenzia sp. THAF82]QFT29238.1 hypothetical protein FIV00_01955 [Labrenzia sp. THAF82]
MKLLPTSRPRIFEDYPTLAIALKNWQHETYRLEDLTFEAGEEVFLEIDDEEPTVLSESKARELNLEAEEELANLKDSFRDDIPLLSPLTTLIVDKSAASFEDFTKQIGKACSLLARELDWSEFAIISDCRRSILSQDNDHPPVRAAQKKLAEFGLTATAPDGLVVDRQGLEAIIGDLFWIARCNASAPYTFVSAKGSSTVATLCKYGNFHFDFYAEDAERVFEMAVPPAGLSIVPDGMCYERFTHDSSISGRALDL